VRRNRPGARPAHHWPKLTALADCASHWLLSAVVTRGPTYDSPQFMPVLYQASRLVPPGFMRRLLGDSGYDAEVHHRWCHQRLAMNAVIIAINLRTRRPGARPARTTPYRRQLFRRFPRRCYRQRWQVESAFSRFKRRFGSALTARTARSMRTEVLLRVLTHNLLLLYISRTFQQSNLKPET